MPQGHPDSRPATGSSTARRSGGAALRETLEALGVEYLFGMESPPALHAELGSTGIKAITVRDERSGAFMADGYAKVRGRPGVCGVSGVGATNMVQGLTESFLGSTPVIVFSEESSGTTRHRNDLQDIDRLPIFASITKWACLIEVPERIADLVAHGFRVATTGRPGPVFFACPWDVVSTEESDIPEIHLETAVYPAARVAPDPTAVAQVARLLRSSARPVVIGGGGVAISGAERELRQLACLLAAPLAVTPSGKGSVDEDDALFAGVVGSYTSGAGGSGARTHDIVRAADLVVLVGTGTGSGATANWTLPHPAQAIVHVDVDPAETGRNYPGSVPLVGDARLALAALLETLGTEPTAPAESWAAERLESARGRPSPAPAVATSGRGLHPERMFATMQAHVGDSTRVVGDAGYCSVWALDRLKVAAGGRRFLGPRGYGTLGYGLPAALGAKLADPASPVLCVSGDGGIGYCLAELETAARYGIAVTAVVFNNSSLAWSRHYNRHFYGYEGATGFLEVDYGAVARGLGCDGVHVSTEDDFAEALEKALSSETTTLIDVEVDPEARPSVDMFG